MKASAHAPFLDLFKLVTAIILLIIFFVLTWTQPAQSLQTSIPKQTLTSLPTPLATATSTPIPPTLTAEPSATEPSLPTTFPTDTSTPSPDETLIPPITEIPSGPEVCAAISRSQLQVGMQATIQREVNFRSSPGIYNNLIRTNEPGTEVEVIGGPACTRYTTGGAYLWWEIKLPDGLTGWSAEASAFGGFYFMEPTK